MPDGGPLLALTCRSIQCDTVIQDGPKVGFIIFFTGIVNDGREFSIEQRKWILKQCWKTENADRVRTAWVEAFHTPPPTRLTIYRITDKVDATGTVANAPKSGRPRTSMSISEKNHQYYTVYCIPTFGPPSIYDTYS